VTEYWCCFCDSWVKISDYATHKEQHFENKFYIDLPVNYNDYRSKMSQLGLIEEK
jgi:hypothetical protein